MIWNGKPKVTEEDVDEEVELANLKLKIVYLEGRVKELEGQLKAAEVREAKANDFIQEVCLQLVFKGVNSASTPYRNLAEAYRAGGARSKDNGSNNSTPTAGPKGRLP